MAEVFSVTGDDIKMMWLKLSLQVLILLSMKDNKELSTRNG